MRPDQVLTEMKRNYDRWSWQGQFRESVTNYGSKLSGAAVGAARR